MNKIGLPQWAVRLAYKFVDVEKYSPTVDERVLEYSFAICKLIKVKPGNLLDIGCVARMNLIPTVACGLGWKVWGIDVRDYNYKYPNFTFVKDDILKNNLVEGFFDVATTISTIEHIGLRGRYGIKEDVTFGDKEALNKIRFLLKPRGLLLLTLPFGSKFSVTGLGRVYDEENLRLLVGGWKVRDKRITGNLAMLELQKE